MKAPSGTTTQPLRPPLIPDPRLQTVKNWTPFAHFDCDKMGPGRAFYDTVVVKATFALAEGVLRRAAEQDEVTLSDLYWDDEAPERSSLKQAGEVVLFKPSTDVIVTGTARSAGALLPSWDASVLVRRGATTIVEQQVRLSGPRVFQHHVDAWALSDPEPTAEVPIRYELAYGGAYPRKPDRAGAEPDPSAPPWVFHPPNPSGAGFFDEDAMDTSRTYRAPQWEPAGRALSGINDEIAVAGFGPTARHWSSRLGHAGTYDDAWERAMRADSEKGLPADYAGDFHPRFFQCAHPDLIAPSYLEGDEEIVLTGVIPAAEPFVMRLPGVRIVARLVEDGGARHEVPMVLDTVHVDVDAGVVRLCWRITLDQRQGIHTALLSAKEAR